MFFKRCMPAGVICVVIACHLTPSRHNVETTSIKRWFNVLTLNQRWIDVVSTLCACWALSGALMFHDYFLGMFISFESTDPTISCVNSPLSSINHVKIKYSEHQQWSSRSALSGCKGFIKIHWKYAVLQEFNFVTVGLFCILLGLSEEWSAPTE